VNALEITGLVARYGTLSVLNHINLVVRQGEVVALLGANGAGKTTTLRAISGVLRHSGSIKLFGAEISGLSPATRAGLGLAHVPQGRGTFASFTVEENLWLGAHTVKNRGQVTEDIQTWFERFPRLGERRRQLAGGLSGGEQQMLAIGRALVARPRLLLLDEPSLGLAPKFITLIFQALRELKTEGKTILLVEQNARKALQVADQAYVMERGRIALSGTGQELLNMPEVQRTYLGQSAA
jgi:branched-chain amino acid transport system ATP-binding protein